MDTPVGVFPPALRKERLLEYDALKYPFKKMLERILCTEASGSFATPVEEKEQEDEPTYDTAAVSATAGPVGSTVGSVGSTVGSAGSFASVSARDCPDGSDSDNATAEDEVKLGELHKSAEGN